MRKLVKANATSSDRGSRTHIELLLVAQNGGHLAELMALEHAWRPYSRIWVTLRAADTVAMLRGEKVVFAYGPTPRNVTNLLRNLVLAWSLLRRIRPQVVLTTGAGVAVPFAWVGRLRGARVMYVESCTRTTSVSMSCRLIAPIADRIFVQWPDLHGAAGKAHYAGNLFRAPS